ncbi:hypothetical protein P152DRAFT_343413 [Eremomyces bilateralis CBS 781.70]|uniref:Life-span regulatory factor-domain-containing protein n=1 Tax=Eremomyces bilateralis CBS 781.70 TaxID=1392243 RepID=A0A6G1G3A6_9PEZI|nr:uncharacterized protein P152DRAFT_343413 [Eremomyces bilateralis CBS 781.70]KAF1812595.1 hypothetical protein P152DRAFT_343413 [Eremomyces bilateralis CBS 781.70]
MTSTHRSSSNKRPPYPLTASTTPGATALPKHSRVSSHLKQRGAQSGRKPKASRKQEQSEPDDDDDDEMVMSFLNFCAICGNQIVHPDHSYLYCSEKCRKQDCNSTWMSYVHQSPPASPFSTTEFEDMAPVRDIVPQRSPRAPGLVSRVSETSISSDEQEQSHEQERKSRSPRKSVSRQDSEAARYLRQFQSSSSIARPQPNRSTTSASLTPSLSDSPSSTPGTNVAFSFPYQTTSAFSPSARPLPPRVNPLLSPHTPSYPRSDLLVQPSLSLTSSTAPALTTRHSASAASKSYSSTTTITPGRPPSQTPPSRSVSHALLPSLKTAPLTSTTTGIDDDAEIFYQRVPLRTGRNEASAGAGSLKQLFSFQQMQAGPTPVGGTSSPTKRGIYD